MEGSQDQKLRLIRESFLRGSSFTVARDVPWIAEPQLRYQLELELGKRNERINRSRYPNGFCESKADREVTYYQRAYLRDNVIAKL